MKEQENQDRLPTDPEQETLPIGDKLPEEVTPADDETIAEVIPPAHQADKEEVKEKKLKKEKKEKKKDNKIKLSDRFTFNKANHKYYLDGKPLTGVTTVLGVIAKPALIQWAANEAIKYIRETQPKPVKIAGVDMVIYTKDQLSDLLDTARVASTTKRDGMADIGTAVHAWLEKFVKGKNPKPNKKLDHITKNFVEWAHKNQIKFLKSEVRVFSEKHWFAGTFDLLFEMNGKIYIGDIKTGSGIYGREPFAQMAGYQICLEEAGYKAVQGRMIIRCGRDGAFETKESLDFETDKKIFLSALDLYRGLKTF